MANNQNVGTKKENNLIGSQHYLSMGIRSVFKKYVALIFFPSGFKEYFFGWILALFSLSILNTLFGGANNTSSTNTVAGLWIFLTIYYLVRGFYRHHKYWKSSKEKTLMVDTVSVESMDESFGQNTAFSTSQQEIQQEKSSEKLKNLFQGLTKEELGVLEQFSKKHAEPVKFFTQSNEVIDISEYGGDNSRDYDNINDVIEIISLTENKYSLINNYSLNPKYTFPIEKIKMLQEFLEQKYSRKLTLDDLWWLLNAHIIDQKIEEAKKQFEADTFNSSLQKYLDYYGENYYFYENLFPFTQFITKKFSEEFEQPSSTKNELLTVAKKLSELAKKRRFTQFEEQLFDKEPLTSLADIDLMTGHEFEEFLQKLFEKKGYKVKRLPLSGDQGADLILEKDNKKIALQAKRYTGIVPNKAIQEIKTAKDYYDCQEAWIVTQSNLTRQAKEVANKVKVKIIDREKLKNLIEGSTW